MLGLSPTFLQLPRRPQLWYLHHSRLRRLERILQLQTMLTLASLVTDSAIKTSRADVVQLVRQTLFELSVCVSGGGIVEFEFEMIAQKTMMDSTEIALSTSLEVSTVSHGSFSTIKGRDKGISAANRSHYQMLACVEYATTLCPALCGRYLSLCLLGVALRGLEMHLPSISSSGVYLIHDLLPLRINIKF